MNNYHDAILFDVDSTLVTIEGLDWIAKKKGIGKEVAKLTTLSMEGAVAMDEIFVKKIDLLAPSKHELALLGEKYCDSLVEDAAETIAVLQILNKEIWLVTGNIMPALLPLATNLSIPFSRIHANEVSFYPTGDYKSINQNCSLTKGKGKSICAQTIGRGKEVAFIGDSVTDMAVIPYVKTFIGFGGVAIREKVKKNANNYVATKSLTPILSYVLTKHERTQLAVLSPSLDKKLYDLGFN